MKKLVTVSFRQFYETNEFVAATSPMRTHYHSKNPIERWIWHSKLNAMRTMATNISYRSVLDVGCGDGGLLRTLNPNSNYTGIDISPTQLTYFRSQIPKLQKFRTGTMTLIEADVVPLPFAAASFDLVLACDVLEHVLSPIKLIHEIKRVLAPSGFALFALPNEPVWQMLRAVALRWPPRSPDHLSFIVPSDITEVFPWVATEQYLPINIPPLHLIHLMLVKRSARTWSGTYKNRASLISSRGGWAARKKPNILLCTRGSWAPAQHSTPPGNTENVFGFNVLNLPQPLPRKLRTNFYGAPFKTQTLCMQ